MAPGIVRKVCQITDTGKNFHNKCHMTYVMSECLCMCVCQLHISARVYWCANVCFLVLEYCSSCGSHSVSANCLSNDKEPKQ